MTKYEENWLIYSTLGIPWTTLNTEITDPEERSFLLGKAEEVKAQMLAQQKQQQEMQQRMMAGQSVG